MTVGWQKISGFFAFAVLCLLVSNRWLLENALPDLGSTLTSEAMGCVLAAGAWGVWHWVRVIDSRRQTRVNGNSGLPSALGLVLALTGPMVGQVISGQALGTVTATFALAMVPVVVSVTSAVMNRGGEIDLVGSLWPGLAALAGLLLLLPEPHLTALRAWLGALAMPLVTGIAGTLVRRSGTGERECRSQTDLGDPLALVAAGCLFGLASLFGFGTRHFSLEAAGLDAFLTLCSAIVLKNLGSLRWSAQFAIVPWLGLVEGMALLRPHTEFRTWVGLALLAAGGARLLLMGEPEARRMSISLLSD